MAVDAAADAIRQLIQDPDLLQRLQGAADRDERKQILEERGIPTDLEPGDISVAAMSVMGTESKPPAGHEGAPEGATARMTVGQVGAAWGTIAGTGCLIAAAALA